MPATLKTSVYFVIQLSTWRIVLRFSSRRLVRLVRVSSASWNARFAQLPEDQRQVVNGCKVYRVAEALTAPDIPFCLCHRLRRERPARISCGRPTLQKPFRQRDLREMFAELYRVRHT
jgi:hypothetical protein